MVNCATVKSPLGLLKCILIVSRKSSDNNLLAVCDDNQIVDIQIPTATKFVTAEREHITNVYILCISRLNFKR